MSCGSAPPRPLRSPPNRSDICEGRPGEHLGRAAVLGLAADCEALVAAYSEWGGRPTVWDEFIRGNKVIARAAAPKVSRLPASR